MNPTIVKNSFRLHSITLSHFSDLIHRCLSLKSVYFSGTVHALLVKSGFNRHTFLGNRCLDLYTRFAGLEDAFRVFDDIADKNTFSWNILLKGLLHHDELDKARQVFDNMPERDVVSWNSMISGFSSRGSFCSALKLLLLMQKSGLRPSVYTFSTLLSVVWSPLHGKQIHGYTIVSGMLKSNMVLVNSLMAMYGRFGHVSYAFGLFSCSEELDVVSWNSWICACHRGGYWEMALEQFHLMRLSGYYPDEFTVSTAVAVCADLYDLKKGLQIFALTVKMDFLSNTIVSSALIDFFSNCDSLDCSVNLFLECSDWNPAVCGSMISSYAKHGFAEEALNLFVLTLREDINPTEFTISSVLCSSSCLIPLMPGLQVHCLAVKLGIDADAIVASSLVDMYAKFGMIESSLNIFLTMVERDIFCWNSMIFGLAQNGQIIEALSTFEQFLKLGFLPDHITFTGVLLACYLGGLAEEGVCIFSAMKNYGVIPRDEHYECVVGTLSRAGKLQEANDLVEMMPYPPSAFVLRSLMCGVRANETLELIEMISHKIMQMEPHWPLPYLVLSRAYEIRGRWESMARVRKAMRDIGVKKVSGYSWILVKDTGYCFESDKLLQFGGQDTYSVLRLLQWDMEVKGHMGHQCEDYWQTREEHDYAFL